jgi:uncharacterized protein involved in outer membrane biogenesis
MKKLFKWIGIVVLILLIAAILVPILFKGKIIQAIKDGANKNMNAKLEFSDASLSLLRNFPNLSLGIENVSIINVAPFAGDTLIYAKDLHIVLDLMSVIGGDKISIRKISADEPVMNFLVNKDGKANWDITKEEPSKPGEPSEPSQFKVDLQKYSVTDGTILYDDQTIPFRLQLIKVNHTGSGDFTQDLFTSFDQNSF